MIGIVPARGGSKRVVSKNMALVGGKPLIVHAAGALSGVCDRVVVSTDDSHIAEAARAWGYDVEDRPGEWCADTVQTNDVLRGWWRPRWPDEWIVILQPTCPQICADDIAGAVNRAKAAGLTEGFGVVMAENPIWTWDGKRRYRVAPEVGMQIYPPGSDSLTGGCVPIGRRIIDVDWPDELAGVRAAMNSKRILFRVLANRRVGSGHVRRCVQIAGELQHHKVGFSAVQGSDVGLVESLCRPFPLVSDEWPHDLCVNDVLDTTEAEMLKLRLLSPVLSLEDCGRGARLSNLVINELYPSGAAGEMVGPDWAVLRPVFAAYSEPHWFDHDGPSRLLVSFGGTDPSGLTDRLRRISGGEDWDTRIVPPPGAGRNIEIAPLLRWADLVVCSGGRTVWEAMACGTPAFVLCQNPREMTHSHLTAGFGVHNGGLGVLLSDEQIASTIGVLLNDRELLADMSARMVGVVDGKGVLRIAGRIEQLLEGL